MNQSPKGILVDFRDRRIYRASPRLQLSFPVTWPIFALPDSYRKGNMGGFHGRIAAIHPNDD